MNAACVSRTIIIYHDGEGWVSRCTEHDEAGRGIMGRIAMDNPLDATTAADAQAEAAKYWGCDLDDVAGYDGPV